MRQGRETVRFTGEAMLANWKEARGGWKEGRRGIARSGVSEGRLRGGWEKGGAGWRWPGERVSDGQEDRPSKRLRPGKRRWFYSFLPVNLQ